MRSRDGQTDGFQTWVCRLAVLSLLLMMISHATFPDPDMFHQMALARESLKLGYVPQEDLFAYTPTVSPAIHHEWGTGALLYGLLVAGGTGAAGLMALKYLLTASVVVGCFLVARRNGGNDPVLLPLAAIAILIGWIGFTTIRAQLVTLCFLTLLLWLFSLDWKGSRVWVFGWLALFVVWLNLHGGVIAGVGLFGIHAAERFMRRLVEERSLRSAIAGTWHLWGGVLAMVPLAFVTPYGIVHAPLLLEAIQLERPRIIEWRPIWQHPDAITTVGLYGMSIVAVGYAVIAKGWRALIGLPLVIVSAYLGVMHIRHASIYAVVWICYVPGYLQGTRLSDAIEEIWTSRKQLVLPAALLMLIACFTDAVGRRFWELSLVPVTHAGRLALPVGAVDHLIETGFQGNVMTPFRAGAYVSWRLYPNVKVSFDGRYEAAYPPEALDENFDFYKAVGNWEETLRKYPTDLVMVPKDTAVHPKMLQMPGWRHIYRDDAYSLFAADRVATALASVSREGVPVVMHFP